MINKVEICGVNTTKLPILSNEEKKELLLKIKNGDKDAREKFINGNLRLVLSVVQSFSGRAESADDLFQIGCIGLIKAIDNFDINLNVQFSTYAVPMIIGEIRRYLRDNNSIRVSRSIKDLAYKSIAFKNKFLKENNREPTIEEIAKEFLNENVKTVDDAITNAGYIIADWISDKPKYRKFIRKYYWYNGLVKGKLKKGAVDDAKVYETYYDFECKITSIKPHQVLALSRADKEKVVTYSLSVKKDDIIKYLENEVIGNKKSPLVNDMMVFIEDAWKRLIEPSMERDIKAELYDKASEFGIGEFGNNLENLLLTPPIKGSVVLGFDPAFRTGCKLAVLSETGEVLEIGVIYPHEPKKEVDMAEKIILALIQKHNIKIIAIGNGTASRESELFVANLIKKYNLDVKYVIVSEAGASVYSASPLAKKEFPDYSVEQRSAVSIGRRLQDALSELVKIDPKSIGVGLYQHDLKQKELDDELGFVVSKVVNEVGVNLNNASDSILNYVSGLNKKVIGKILDYKKKNGSFKSREELKKVSGMDEKTFEQCAGFLRIFGSNPLDKTNIHPEDYELVLKILNDYNVSESLVGTKDIEEKLKEIKTSDIINKYNISVDKWETIKNNLVNGVIDPRDEIKQMNLRSDVLTIDDFVFDS